MSGFSRNTCLKSLNKKIQPLKQGNDWVITAVFGKLRAMVLEAENEWQRNAFSSGHGELRLPMGMI